jgi:hypothetical protein
LQETAANSQMREQLQWLPPAKPCSLVQADPRHSVANLHTSNPAVTVKPGQNVAFKNQGYLYLKGALRNEVVQPVNTYVVNELKRLNIWSGRMLSDRLKGLPSFQQIARLGQMIKYPGPAGQATHARYCFHDARTRRCQTDAGTGRTTPSILA